MADTDTKAALGSLTPSEVVGKIFAALLDMTPVYA
jgi:hypothetical protein